MGSTAVALRWVWWTWWCGCLARERVHRQQVGSSRRRGMRIADWDHANAQVHGVHWFHLVLWRAAAAPPGEDRNADCHLSFLRLSWDNLWSNIFRRIGAPTLDFYLGNSCAVRFGAPRLHRHTGHQENWFQQFWASMNLTSLICSSKILTHTNLTSRVLTWRYGISTFQL